MGVAASRPLTPRWKNTVATFVLYPVWIVISTPGSVTWHLLGLEYNIYGWHGLWLVETVSFFPLAFITLAGTLKALNPTLEQAANSLGAGGGRIFRTVTLPLLLPGVSSAALLVATEAMYDAGYISSRALHERASEQLGMAPRAYKRGGASQQIAFTLTDGPLGPMLIAATGPGVYAVRFGDEKALLRELQDEYPKADLIQGARTD